MRDRIEACQRCHWWGQPWTSGQSGQAARPVAVWLASGGLVAWRHVQQEQQSLAILLLANLRRQKNFGVFAMSARWLYDRSFCCAMALAYWSLRGILGTAVFPADISQMSIVVVLLMSADNLVVRDTSASKQRGYPGCRAQPGKGRAGSTNTCAYYCREQT